MNSIQPEKKVLTLLCILNIPALADGPVLRELYCCKKLARLIKRLVCRVVCTQGSSTTYYVSFRFSCSTRDDEIFLCGTWTCVQHE